MTHRLATNYAKNNCSRTSVVKVIVENVVTCFLGHSVYLHVKHHSHRRTQADTAGVTHDIQSIDRQSSRPAHVPPPAR